MHSVLNDTKWDELRLAMHELGPLRPQWSTKDLSGYICPYDGDWFYRFREGGYRTIEWVDIRVDTPEQREAVQAVLRRVHLPGEQTDSGFRVYGHVPLGTTVNYI